MTFAEFFPLYLQAHSKRSTQRMHAGALVAAFLFAGFCVASGRWTWLPISIAIGYAGAWSGHLLFEKNTPLFFKHPFYSVLGEFKMSFLVLIGKL